MNSIVFAVYSLLADVPIFDARGPEFLGLYGIGFVVAGAWSVLRARRATRQFEVPSKTFIPIDPYHVAYLAGGGARATQLAIVRLLRMGLLQWRSGFLGARLVLGVQELPSGLSDVERRVMTRVCSGRAKGVAVSDLLTAARPEMRALEVKLAVAGLRPTADERSRACFASVVPMVFLAGVGLLKLCVGLSRERPVIFLMIALFLTLIGAFVIASRVKRLTPAGQNSLDRLRVDYQKSQLSALPGELDCLPMITQGMALLGVSCLATTPAFCGIYPEMKNQFGAANRGGGGDASSGVGSGGGDSGCGGGCGGCGGGGD